MKKLFLLDAMALIYRAYFAYSKNPLVNSKGLNTSAIFGFTNTLLDILFNEKPTHIAVAFDSREPTARHLEYTEYKAHRDVIPEDIVTALPYIRKIIEEMNIPVIALPGYEADDIIGTLAMKAQKSGFTTYMVTPDKDFGQLVTDKIFILKPPRFGSEFKPVGVAEICEKYGLQNPVQVTDILGLAGDASDNIPGVPGIGEKTAVKLVQEFGSVENLLKNTASLKGKIKENVENFSNQALLSKKLATIILDVPVPFEETKLIRTPPNEESLKKLFDELEFRRPAGRLFGQEIVPPPLAKAKAAPSLFDDLDNKEENRQAEALHPGHPAVQVASSLHTPETGSTIAAKETIATYPHQYHLVDTPVKLAELHRLLNNSPFFCFDTETTGIDPHNCGLVGISFAVKPGEAYYVPIPELHEEALKTVNEFKAIFSNEKIEKTGQNIKYDICVLNQYGILVAGKLFDTMLAHYLIQPEAPHNMNSMAAAYLNYEPVPIEELIGKKGKNQGSMRNVDAGSIKEYACEDADVTLRLKQIFEPKLRELKLSELFENVEMKLVYVLASMENEGIVLDTGTLKTFSAGLEEETKKIELEIYRYAGREFNIASPKQLSEILFSELKISEKPRKTPTGQFSTREDAIAKLADKHPVIPLILDFRELQKLKSTYVDALPDLINKRTGKIHTTFNQAVAVTGRLSSDNPNLQNIPVRTAKGKEVRKAFVPGSDGFTFLSADYSQIELRIMAAISGDEAMIDAFKEGLDIHAATAARIYGTEPGKITPEMRRKAKMVNFGIIYGISAFGLSERLNIPRGEAAQIIEHYFREYPKVKKYMEKTIAFARKYGYVETLLGRRRYLRDIASQNNNIRQNAERNAINAPIQGTAADMIKVAMINIHGALTANRCKTKMLLQVHDELIFDLKESEMEMIIPIVTDKMKTALKINVPIEVDIKTGKNWMEAH